MADIPYISPTGSKVWVPEQNAKAAEAAGYKFDDGTFDQPIRAGLEEAARTATLGLSDQFLIDNEEDRKLLKARRENNPIARTIGGIAGGFVPGVGTTGKVIGGVRGLVAEGALMGLSEVITESTLDNTPLTAERLATGMAGGAVLGGGLGVGAKAVGAGFGKVVDMASPLVGKLGSQSVKELLESGAQKIERMALLDDAGKELLRKANVEYPQGLAIDDALNFGRAAGAVSPGSSFSQDALSLLDDRIKQVNGKIGEYLNKMDSAVPFSREVVEGATVNGRMDARAKLLSDMRASLDKFRKNAAYDDAVRLGEKKIAALESKEALTWSDIWDTQRALRESVDKLSAGTTEKVIESLRVAMRDNVMSASERLAPGSRDAFHALVKERAAGELARDLFESRMLKSKLDVKDIGMGVLFGGGDPIAGAAIAVARNQVHKRGGFIAAAALRKLADSGLMERVANNLHNRTGQILSIAPEVLGPFRMQIERAFAQGALDLLQTHTMLATSARGDDYLSRMAMTRETPEEEAATSKKLSLLGAAVEANNAAQEETRQAIEGFFKAGPGRPPKDTGSLTPRQFEMKFKALEQIVKDPEALFSQIPSELNGTMPGTAVQAGATVLKAAQLLFEKAPKNPTASLPPGLQQPWEPSTADLARWGRYVQAIEDPNEVLRMLGRGTATSEHIEALQRVYPAIYNDLKEKLVERVMQGGSVTGDRRAALAQILGPMAAGRTPAQQMLIQSVHDNVQQGPEGGGGRPDGRQVVNQEKNYQTQSQRMEERSQGME